MSNKSQKKKTVILSVSNDLITDRRVDKVAQSLHSFGFSPLLIGRKLKNSKSITKRNYSTIRMSLFFYKSALFYAEYNIRLFFLLLFKKADILLANDLDTLPANYLAYLVKKNIFRKRIVLIYDSHELFTEVPELNGRKFAKNTWLFIEKIILPKIKYAYTVCQSIADEYSKKYGIKMQVIRNVPVCKHIEMQNKKAEDLKLRFKNKKIILYQGALNIGRGLEESILAMQHIENTILLLIGEGDISSGLRKLVSGKKLDEKVYFTGRIPLHELNAYTKTADLGLVLQADLSLSYRYVLPNRLFDYLHAEIPVLASCLPEIEKIVATHQAGILIDTLEPQKIAEKINHLLFDEKKLQQIKENIKKIKDEYCWEKEEEILHDIFSII